MCRRTFLFISSLPLLLAACAHRADPRPAELDPETVQPRVDELARAAVKCLRTERAGAERMVEVEAATDGTVRAWAHPYPAPLDLVECVGAAGAIRLQPTSQPVRSFMHGDGRLGDPRGLRERSLSLRARMGDRKLALDACRAVWETGQRNRPDTIGRIGFLVEAQADGSLARVEVESASPEVTPDAQACFTDALREAKLPAYLPPDGRRYRFPVLFSRRGLLIGAPHTMPLDPHDKRVALDAVEPAALQCLRTYRLAGQVLIHVRFGPDGVPQDVRIERPSSSVDDRGADACLQQAYRAARVPPFDGAPVTVTAPFRLQ